MGHTIFYFNWSSYLSHVVAAYCECGDLVCTFGLNVKKNYKKVYVWQVKTDTHVFLGGDHHAKQDIQKERKRTEEAWYIEDIEMPSLYLSLSVRVWIYVCWSIHLSLSPLSHRLTRSRTYMPPKLGLTPLIKSAVVYPLIIFESAERFLLFGRIFIDHSHHSIGEPLSYFLSLSQKNNLSFIYTYRKLKTEEGGYS